MPQLLQSPQPRRIFSALKLVWSRSKPAQPATKYRLPKQQSLQPEPV